MKRLLTVLLSLVLVASFVTGVFAAASDDVETGKTIITDDNWAYEKVAVYGYEIDSYIGSSARPSVPYSFAKEYVNSIGEYAFNGNTVVTEVTTTEKIETIGDYAFNGCTALRKVVLFDTLNAIGVGAFYGDTALNDVNLRDTSISAVSAYCFAESGITSIALPKTCERIENMAFYNCSGLTSITIPNSVTSIDDTAFSGCDNVVIRANSDSYAIAYAMEKGIDYEFLDATTVTFVCGDADGDGDVTILDATKVQRILAELDVDIDGMIALRGDSDEDELGIMDATRIQRWLAEYEVSAPIGESVTKNVMIDEDGRVSLIVPETPEDPTEPPAEQPTDEPV